MEINIIETGPLERQVEVTLGGDQVEEESTRAYAKLRRQVSIKGFRPGKVPHKELVRRFGKGLRTDVIQSLIQSSIAQALAREDLQPVLYLTPPEVTEDSGQGGFAFRFRAEIAPVVHPQGYLGTKLVVPEIQVTEEMIDRQIDLMREEQAVIEPVEDRQTVEPQDLLSLSIKPVDPNLPADSLTMDQGVIDLGSEHVFSGLAEGVTGMSVGETREVTVHLVPESRLARDLGVTELVVSVEVHGIKRKVLPPLDDEFARTTGHVETYEQLRQDIRQRQLRAVERDRREKIRERLEEKLLEQHPMDIPGSYLKNRIEEDFEQKLQRFRMAGLTEEDLEGSMGSIHELVTENVKRHVRLEFILKAIADREGIRASSTEVDRFIADLIRQSGGNAVRLKKHFSEPGRRSVIEEQLRLDKTLDFLLSQTTILTEEESEAETTGGEVESAVEKPEERDVDQEPPADESGE